MDVLKSITGGGATGLVVGIGMSCLINRAIRCATKKYDSVGCCKCRNIIGSDENWKLGFRCKCVPLYCKFLRVASHEYTSSNFIVRREALTENIIGYGVVYGPVIGALICYFSPTVGLIPLVAASGTGAFVLELLFGGGTLAQKVFFTSYGGLLGLACTVAFRSMNFGFSKIK